MKNFKYTTYKHFICDCCNFIHENKKINLENDNAYLQCDNCGHCQSLSNALPMVENTISKEVDKLSTYHNDKIEDNFIPFAKVGEVVSGKGECAENYGEWATKIVHQGRNPFSGRVLNVPDTPIERNNIEYINVVQFLEQIEDFYGLQNHRNIKTKSNLHSCREKRTYIEENYPDINCDEFFKKNIHDFNEIEKEAHFALSELSKTHPVKESKIIESDLWLEFFKLDRRVSNGYKNTFNNFFNLSKWKPEFWAYILLMDTLTKDHPARDGNNINLYFFW